LHGFLNNENMRIPTPNKIWEPPQHIHTHTHTHTLTDLGGQAGYFEKLPRVLKLGMNIPIKKQIFGTPPPYLGGKGAYFEKLSKGSETLDRTSERLGEMFKGDSTDTCGRKWGDEWTRQACAGGERGSPLV
jgi:hypothetical protein